MNNSDLVNYSKKALSEGWGYVWGTFGQVLTPALLQEKINQYAQGVGNYADFIKSHWMGRHVTDCVGLIKGCYWNGSYNSATDVSADGMLANATKKGDISTIPDIPGICVHKSGHIGVYIGNDQVIEAHGTMYGVIQTPLHGGTPWTDWLECPYITYNATASTQSSTTNKGYLTSGDKGQAVVDLQKKLIALGYELVGGADGSYGQSTSNAVIAFQKKYNLTADNEVGPATSHAIDVILSQKVNPIQYGIVTASILNVRNGAGAGSAVIGQLTKGQIVKLDKKVGDWWSIYFGNHGGYVSAAYICLK